MTEAEWLACTNPLAMLRFLGDRASPRKLRLFACACCRRVWELLSHSSSRYAVELAERSADEPVDERELDMASGDAEAAFEDTFTDDDGMPVLESDLRPAAASAASYASSPGRLEIERHLFVVVGDAATALNSDASALAELLRDVFPHPARPSAADPGWRAPTILALARAAYQERHFPGGDLDAERLAVLSDALEDAGCSDAAILSHLRGPGPHVRGCWPLDLLLGKE